MKELGSFQRQVLDLVRDGVCDEDIVRRFPSVQRSSIRCAIAAAHQAIFEDAGGPLRWRGPWPVVYTYPKCAAFPKGMKVYRVGAGHDVQESALKPLGFRL